MSEKLKIVYRPLQELSPYAHNARTHSPEQVAQLVESIKQFGWTNPVLIDEKGEIIAGHGRVMAAEMLKMDSVPVIVLSGLTDEQKKAYRLADNRLPMNAGWDEDLLRMELSDLINADFDVSLRGIPIYPASRWCSGPVSRSRHRRRDLNPPAPRRCSVQK